MVLSSGKCRISRRLMSRSALLCRQRVNSPPAPSCLRTAIADVRHDPHVQHDVDAVGQLDADLAEGRADRAHGEGDDVHGAAAHGALEDLARPAVALLGRHPVVRRAGVFLERRADVGQVLGPAPRRSGPCGGRGSRAASPGSSSTTSPVATASSRQPVLLLLRPVDPEHAVRLAQPGHFLDPFLQFPMLIHAKSLFALQLTCKYLVFPGENRGSHFAYGLQLYPPPACTATFPASRHARHAKKKAGPAGRPHKPPRRSELTLSVAAYRQQPLQAA